MVSPLTGARTERQVLAALQELVPAISARVAREDRPHAETFADLRAAGLPSFVIPAAYGGGGATLPQASRVIRTLAAADASAALVLAMHYIHGTRLLSPQVPGRGAAELGRTLAVTDGLVNFASSERLSGAPSRGGAVQTRATRGDDGSWLLSGHKRYVTGSIALDHLLVSATVDDDGDDTAAEPVARTFVVPADADGVRIEPTWDTFGMRGSASHDVILDGVTVSADAVAEAYDPEVAPEITRTFGAWWALLLASIHLGIAEAAREAALVFATGPRGDGRPGSRAEQPRTQEHAARVELALLQARLLLEDAARRCEGVPEPADVVQATATKLLVHRHASDAVDHACRLVGGASVWNASPLGRHFRDLRVALFNPPNEDVVIDAVGRAALGLNEKGTWT
ncbi:acyl-CoA dehydrogenase family protein [Streptosporangium amethystogenes subsp. fukuiense]|uniref:Acyl-CoA dehydrogenase family protein n=1 Tax=Streptosporangium amethystogenes subsp. fukuiense TaxID=698418 RepID=A0ABW2SS14_9ACTN